LRATAYTLAESPSEQPQRIQGDNKATHAPIRSARASPLGAEDTGQRSIKRLRQELPLHCAVTFPDREGLGRRGRGGPRESAPCGPSGRGSPARRSDWRRPARADGAELEPRISAEAVLGALEQAAARHDGW
jgi:hypothetical protein